MDWYYAAQGRPSGPVDDEALRRLAAEGTVSGDTLVWQTGMESWIPARTVTGLFGAGGGQAALAPAAAAAVAEASGPAPSYRDNTARAALSSLFLIVTALVDVAAILAGIFQLVLLRSVAAGKAVPQSRLDVHEVLYGLTGVVQIVLIFAAAIAFLLWFRRAYDNLAAFGVARQYSPGWVVGGFLVPLINLVRPHEIAQEIWSGSRPQTGGAARGGESSRLITAWWTLFVLMNLAGQVSGRLMMRAKSTPELQTATWAALAGDVLSCAAAVAAVYVIRAVQAAQTARAAQA